MQKQRTVVDLVPTGRSSWSLGIWRHRYGSRKFPSTVEEWVANTEFVLQDDGQLVAFTVHREEVISLTGALIAADETSHLHPLSATDILSMDYLLSDGTEINTSMLPDVPGASPLSSGSDFACQRGATDCGLLCAPSEIDSEPAPYRSGRSGGSDAAAESGPSCGTHGSTRPLSGTPWREGLDELRPLVSWNAKVLTRIHAGRRPAH